MGTFITIYIISVIVGLVVMYFLILYAVRAGNKPIHDALRVLINMKAGEMKKEDV